MLTPDDNVPVCADITQPRGRIVTHSGGSNPGPGPGERLGDISHSGGRQTVAANKLPLHSPCQPNNNHSY